MANGVFLPVLGRVATYHDNVANNSPSGAGLVCVLLKAAQADADLEDYEDLATLLAHASNTEADATGYARQTLLTADVTAVSVDTGESPPTANATTSANFEFGVLGGATNNSLVKAIICYAANPAGADSTFIPLCHYDFVVTTDGVLDITAKVPSAGYWLAYNYVA